MSEEARTRDEPATPVEARGPMLLRGTAVHSGLAIGVAHCKEDDLARVSVRRVSLDRVESELNRFHQALSDSKRQLEELKQRLRGTVPEDHVQILDTHVAYLKDSVFLSDVENLILNEQMSLEGAIAKVIADFDRIFKLVQSETLRARAVDLRDVGIRVLRSLERLASPADERVHVPSKHVLVARELSIVDMFNLSHESVEAILTEEGSLAGHAAILARSMRIPTLTDVEGLLDAVDEGDLLIVDAVEGVVLVRPGEGQRAEYAGALRERQEAEPGERPAWADLPVTTADGEPLAVSGLCANLSEVERSVVLGMAGVGLYRTELSYLVDRNPPALEVLTAHYRAVLEAAGPRGVTFRLLDVDSSLDARYLHAEREPNPALGRMGVRLLLAREDVLRCQLRAILQASAQGPVRIAVPKVIDCGELRRVREILFEERFALKKAGIAFDEEVDVGVVIETPASAIGARDLAEEADFLVVNLNSLQQYLLAADRDNTELAGYFAQVHPFVLRVLGDVLGAAESCGKRLELFGVTAVAGESMGLLLGLGVRHFCVAPGPMATFVRAVRRVDLRQASRAVERALRAACPAEVASELEGYGHGRVRG